MQFRILFFLFSLILTQFNVIASEISGIVTLENQETHADVSVRFVAISNSARTNDALSNGDGEYNLQLENGIYKLIISKEGFTDFVLDEISIEGDSVLNAFELLERGEKQVAGIVAGTLYKDTTYYVTSDLIIQQGSQLLIEPGTHVKFNGKYEIRVYGRLLAEGTENDSILFTPNKTNKEIGDWKRIILYGNDTSKISYSILEYGGAGYTSLITLADSSNVFVNNSRIEYSERGGIYLFSSNYGELENNKVGYAENSGVYFDRGTSGHVKDNFFYGGLRGFYHESADVEVSNNVFFDNYIGISTASPGMINNNVFVSCSRGISFLDYTGDLLVRNNTFIDNLHGIAFSDDNDINPRILNNVFYNNQTGIGFVSGAESGPSSVSYNLFYGNEVDYESSLSGFGNIITENSNNTPSDTYYNIFEDPLLYLPEITEPYYGAIKDNSPAIGASSEGNDIGAYNFENVAPASFSILSNEITYYDYDSINLDVVWEESVDSDEKAEVPFYRLFFVQEDTVFQVERIESTSFQFQNNEVLDQNTEYEISVISSDGLSKTSANNIASFITPNLAPSAFQIVDLQIVNTENFNKEISINWSPNLDTDSLTYSVMVGNNGNYESIGETTENSTTLEASLIENTSYECFILAEDGQLSASSDTISFLTPNSAPSGFQLLFPQNDSLLFEREVTFTWEEATDQSAVSYQLTIYNNDENIKVNDIETNQFSLNTVENLNPSSEYLWFVSATDGVDTTFSLSRRFSTNRVLSTENSHILDLKAYPNPAGSQINVDLPFNEIYYYEIFSVNGKLLDYSKLNRNGAIDISKLAEGIYQLKILSEKDDKIRTVRFMKK